MPRLKFFLPLAAFALLGILLFRGLSLDPTALPSALIGKSLPEFALADLHTGEPQSRESLVGAPMLINVWATWCYSCRVEHPFLLELAERGIKIVGLNYKDDSAKALQWLADLGDPYAISLADTEGVFGLDLGVYGAPETYIAMPLVWSDSGTLGFWIPRFGKLILRPGLTARQQGRPFEIDPILLLSAVRPCSTVLLIARWRGHRNL